MKNFSASQNPDDLLLLQTSQQQDQDDDQFHPKPRSEWDFNLSTLVSSTSVAASDTLGVTEFDPSDTLLATGGIARRIRIYNFTSLLPHGQTPPNVTFLDHATACDYYICTPAKLSSLRWKPGSSGRILGSADYDGVVMEYDLEKRTPVFERDEHGGRRVWSMDYSHLDPVVGASGSDDGTMQMWDPRCEVGNCVAKVTPSMSRSPVCCVEFNPFGGSSVVVGCADRRVYGYDVRMMLDPVMVLEGHQKTVTYGRYLDHRTLVTSGTDGCLKMWDTDEQRLVRTFRGHINRMRFIGLSVRRSGGLISCGSESNEVFVYDTRWGEPIWVHGFEPVGRDGGGFVSSVGWRQVGEDECTLVAGGSDGALHVFVGKRKPFS